VDGEWHTLVHPVDRNEVDVSDGVCPECVEAYLEPQLQKVETQVRALMILHRDGQVLRGSVSSGDLRYVPAYRVTTWTCLQPGEPVPQMEGVFAQWTAPFDEHRFTIPMWVQEAAAAEGVVIR
jgi:hypothetical protein